MNHVILVGFMGCGKTTIGIRLSYRLRRVVEDTDRLVEKKAGMSIRAIFDEQGEAAFREMETQCLRDLSGQKEPRIISTGGGLPMQEENHELLKELGTVVYLKISPECVWNRLKNDTTRPLLQCENPMERIEELLSKRAPVYESIADITIEVDGKFREDVAAEILDRLKEKGIVAPEGENEDEDTCD